jgi:hypothetical protein
MEAISLPPAALADDENKILTPLEAKPALTLCIPDEDEEEDDDSSFFRRKSAIWEEDDGVAARLQALIKAYEKQAREYMEKFFKDKKFHCGGAIPQKQLFSDANVDLVLSTTFCEGVDMAYEMVENIRVPRNYEQEIEYDIYLVLDTICAVKACGIPKPFQGGIVLLYLKFCKGMALPESATSKGRDLSNIMKADYYNAET